MHSDSFKGFGRVGTNTPRTKPADVRDDGGPAYPIWTEDMQIAGSPGMSIRDHFAGQIAASMIGGRTFWSADEPAKVAQDAYEVADALIKARAR